MVMMFFIKLRHGLSDEDIADRIDVHSSTVYGQKNAPLIKWPDRDTLYKIMPLAFWKLEMLCYN